MDFWHTFPGSTEREACSQAHSASSLPGSWHRVLTSHTTTVSCCAPHPTNANVYASAGLQGEVLFWHAPKRSRLGQVYWPVAPATSIAFSLCGNLVAMGLVNGAVEICDRNRVQQHLFPLFRDKVNDIKFSPDGRWMAAGSDDTTLVLFACRPHLRPLVHCRGHAAAVMSLDFASDSATLQTVCRYSSAANQPKP